MSCSVLVVGAGLSGLAAADLLIRAQPSLNVLVLQAMDRVGGRTYSVQLHGAMFDLGGMWVGKHQKHVLALAERAKSQIFDQPCEGLKILQLGNRIGSYPTDIPNNVNIIGLAQMQYYIWKLNRMARTVPVQQPDLCPDAQLWDSITVFSWIQQNIWFQKVVVRAVFGTQANEISMLFFLWYTHQSGSVQNLINIKNGNQEKKFLKGSQSLSLFLKKQIEARGVSVKLNSRVQRIQQTEKTVKVYVLGSQAIECQYVIMACPPTAACKILFQPKLSIKRQLINQKCFMGSIIKILVLYKERFWLQAGFSGQTISDCIDSPVFNAYDDSRPNCQGRLQPALVVFVNGAVARFWSQSKQLVQKTLLKLSQYFGQKALDPLQTHVQDWTQNQFTRGGPIGNFAPGLLSNVGKLTSPEGRVHWAGTELAYESQGFMDGAIESGERAARQIIDLYEGLTPQKEQNQVGRYMRLITSAKRWFNYFI